ncbi:hypothetical protein OWR29_46880 [Actinoplanes sp. Pm04-4]|uniref:Uncharacterized protein n=1 Tax=Paractinoplanes pyxinae TaxID=2997416 RepID=A0ABT4BGK3_9ACTN|nr:hypothetical protein [Actinoplanes pyxinae]MCY1145576.1 hypothetical protein [Actinoplanes pyxinae]
MLLAQLEKAAATAHRKQDLFLAKLVDCEAAHLKNWASLCNKIRDFRGCLAAAVQQSN